MTDTASRAEAAPSGATAPTAELADDLAADLLRKLNERTARILIVGQGYVGLPVSMRAVEVGFDVVGLEASPDPCRRPAGGQLVRRATSPTSSSGAALDAGYRADDATRPTSAGFDVAVITVPTPLRDGAPDLSYVERAARVAGPHAARRRARDPRVDDLPGHHRGAGRPDPRAVGPAAGDDFFLGYSPERIDPGNARVDAS